MTEHESREALRGIVGAMARYYAALKKITERCNCTCHVYGEENCPVCIARKAMGGGEK